MKKLLYIVCICVLFFSNCKCKKENPQPVEPAVPSQPLTDYSYFKKGTYWILKDSATGTEDSVYVFFDSTFQYHLGPGNFQRPGDYMYYYYRSFNFTDNYRYDFDIDYGYYGTMDNNPDSPNKIIGVQRKKFKPGDYVGTSILMSNIFDERYPSGYYGSPGTIYYKEWFDSLNVDGIVYRNVAHFRDTENASEMVTISGMGSFAPTTDYFIAKNIGVVRIRINDYRFGGLINKTQNLIRYHIVQ